MRSGSHYLLVDLSVATRMTTALDGLAYVMYLYQNKYQGQLAIVYTMRTKSIHTRKFFIKNVLFVENKH